MVTNLPQQAKAKWAEAQAARDPAAKLRLLREFYSMFPKHKGTERLERSIKRQIVSLEGEVERRGARRVGSTRLEWVVRKEDFLQLALVGSVAAATSLFNRLTGLGVRQYDALAKPTVGVFKGASVRFQILLTPFDPVIGEQKQEQLMNLARNCDGVLIVFDHPPVNYVDEVTRWFAEHSIDIRSHRLGVEIQVMPSGGIRVVGSPELIGDREIVEFLQGYNIRNAVVKAARDATLDDLEDALFGRVVKGAVFVAVGADSYKELRQRSLNALLLSPEASLDLLAHTVLETLGLIRVYTRSLNGEVVDRPVLVKRGARAIEVAEMIHKDFARLFDHAKVWRESAFSGTRVGRNFQLHDGDVVEFHT